MDLLAATLHQDSTSHCLFNAVRDNDLQRNHQTDRNVPVDSPWKLVKKNQKRIGILESVHNNQELYIPPE